MQGIELVRVGLQDLLIELLRLRPMAGLMMPHPLGQQRSNREHGRLFSKTAPLAAWYASLAGASG
jgi:hypothetical protein